MPASHGFVLIERWMLLYFAFIAKMVEHLLDNICRDGLVRKNNRLFEIVELSLAEMQPAVSSVFDK